MVTQRAVALVVFIAVVTLGSVVALVLIPAIREERWRREGDDLEAFLTDYSRAEKNKSLAGAPAVVFRQENETNYADEPPEEAKVFIQTRTVPNAEVVRKMLENRRYRVFRTAQKNFETNSTGVIVVNDTAFLITQLQNREGRLMADLWSPQGEKVGVLEIEERTENVIQGTITIVREGKRVNYDVFIPLDHPNRTNLYQTVQVYRPMDRMGAMTAVKRSFNVTVDASRVAPRK
jgi:hypothetical protein